MSNKFQEEKPKYNIVLVGKTGVGKSATGNTILGRKIFKDSSSSTSCTSTCSLESIEYDDVILNVLDTPGLMDTKKSHMEILDELANIMSFCPEGFHAFIVVLRWDVRYTEEELNTFIHLKQIFGEDFLKVCIVAFTRGDVYEMSETDISFEQWLKKQHGELPSLLNYINNKTVLFYNRMKYFAYDLKRKESIDKIFRMIKTDNLLYTNTNFEKAALERNKLATKYKLPQLKAKYQTELSILQSKISLITEKEPSGKNTLLDESSKEEAIKTGDSTLDLKKLAKHILELIKNDDNDTGYLDEFRNSMKNLKKMISGIKTSKSNLTLKLQKLNEYTLLLKNPPSKFSIIASSIALVGTAVGGTIATVLTSPVLPVAATVAASTGAVVAANASSIALNASILKIYNDSLKQLKDEIDKL